MTRETELELDILRAIDGYSSKLSISMGEFSTLLPQENEYQPIEIGQRVLQMIGLGLVDAVQQPRLGQFGGYSGLIRSTLPTAGRQRLDELRRE